MAEKSPGQMIGNNSSLKAENSGSFKPGDYFLDQYYPIKI